MPFVSVGRRLVHLVAGRPVRVKHHLHANAAAPLAAPWTAALPQPLNQDGTCVPCGVVGVPGGCPLHCHHRSDAPCPSSGRHCSTLSAFQGDCGEHPPEVVETPGQPAEGTGNRAGNTGRTAEGQPGETDATILLSSKASAAAEEGSQSCGPQERWAGASPGSSMQPGRQPAPWTRWEGAEGAAPSSTWALVEKAMRSAQRGLMPQRGRTRDPQLLRLWALLRCGLKEEAKEGLRALLEERGALPIKDCNYLLKACATGGQDTQVELGLHVYATMTEWGITPDVKSIAWMLRLFVRAGQVQEALPWLTVARRALPSLEDRETGVVRSPAYFLNVLLEECITRRDWAAAGRCADELGGYRMDAKTFLLLLQIAGLERRPKAVALTWAGLCGAASSPTPEQRSAYIQALARCGSVGDAVRELGLLGTVIQGGAARSDRAESGQRRGQDEDEGSGDLEAGVDGGASPPPFELGPDAAAGHSGQGGAGRVAERGLWWAAPPPRSTDKSTLAHLRVAYNAVIAAAARAKDGETANDLFAEMRRADLQPDRYTYNALLRAVAATQSLEDTKRVFRGMQAGGILPDEHTVAALVTALTAAGQLENGAALLEGATSATPRAAHYTVPYNALLSAHAQQGDPEGALRVFQQMKAHQVAPDACTYLALFQAFNHGRKPDRAEPAAGDAAAERGVAEQLLRLEEDMRGAGVQHTAQTHTALVAALGPASLDLLLERVARAKQASSTSAAAPLDAAFFAVAIGVCTGAKQLRPAVALWADMAALGVRPNVAAYDALINCCAETGALQRGLRLADEALRGGLRADCSTVNAVIKLCCFCECYRAALPLLFRAEAAGARSDVVGYNLLLRSAAMARDLPTLERLLERMKRRRIVPDGDTCLAAVTAYVQKDAPDDAAEALDALTARMFGHGGATTTDDVGLTKAVLRNVQAGVERPILRPEGGPAGRPEWLPSEGEGRGRTWGPQDAAQRGLHVGSGSGPASLVEEDWEFVGDSLEAEGHEAEAEDGATADLLRRAMLAPTTEARSEFLARMVGVSGGGFEGPPLAWKERAVALQEMDWNGWARRLREQYDARKCSWRARLSPTETAC